MLLTIDLGNTSIKLGLFDDSDKLYAFCEQPSKQEDFAAIIRAFIYKANVSEIMVTDTIISSVVPKANGKLLSDIEMLFGKEAIFIDPTNAYGIDIDIPNPLEVGTDLLVMSAYAYQKFKKEMIIISFGTATVLSYISNKGAFTYCIIAPGIKTIAETLWKNAAKLNEFEVHKPSTILANNTNDAMNVGIYEGYIGMLQHLLDSLKQKTGNTAMVVACGGFGKEVYNEIKGIDYYETDLVTMGLHDIYKRYFS